MHKTPTILCPDSHTSMFCLFVSCRYFTLLSFISLLPNLEMTVVYIFEPNRPSPQFIALYCVTVVRSRSIFSYTPYIALTYDLDECFLDGTVHDSPLAFHHSHVHLLVL